MGYTNAIKLLYQDTVVQYKYTKKWLWIAKIYQMFVYTARDDLMSGIILEVAR